MIKENVLPRMKLRNGRIEKLIPGSDQLIRGAEIRIFQGKLGKTLVIKRPIQLLVPLEIYCADNYGNNSAKPEQSDTQPAATLEPDLDLENNKLDSDGTNSNDTHRVLCKPKRVAAMNADVFRRLKCD